MAKINQKSYTYILSILFAVGGLIYINIIDETDEKIYNAALKSGKKEIFAGKLKSIELVGLSNELVFYNKDSSTKTFLVSEINTTHDLRPKDIVADNWYQIVKIVNANKIIEMHRAVTGTYLDEVKDLTHSDKEDIKKYIEEEFTQDLILSIISIILVLFSSYKIYKYQSSK